MLKKIAICPNCQTKNMVEGELDQQVEITCSVCGTKGVVSFTQQDVAVQESVVELDFYAVNEPFTYIKILKNTQTLDKYYRVIEPFLSPDEEKSVQFIQETLLKVMDHRLDELEKDRVDEYLVEQIEKVINDYDIKADEVFKKKILYYVVRDFLGYGKIDPLMRDTNIEDISCDGANISIFLYHKKYGSLRSSIQFDSEEELSAFVIKLAQKCGKHISIAEPMLDATMPDGSRIQMTLSKTVTAKGSTFTIRKFRADPITPTDLIEYHSMSPEMVAYMWLAVEHGINAIFAGGTAAGKTSTLNALSLFIPREAKIVSIEETREINLPHPNWIPGVVRSGFGEVVHDKFVGEIDLFDLMKAALRQRPEYILVGEIRGQEAYVLFQAMATGHTTYSTFHADSTKSLIHRLEGKPIEVPRIMLQSLDIISIQVSAQVGDKRVRRCKQIVEIVDIDPMTKEILTNEVFRWDPIEDRFIYSGKSYILERIRSQYDMDKEAMMQEIKRRVDILNWMHRKGIRSFKEVAQIVAWYAETPDELMQKVRNDEDIELLSKKKDTLKKNIERDVVYEKKMVVDPASNVDVADPRDGGAKGTPQKRKRIGFRRRE
ncbi:MAG: ATPase, T2SS/T4P/T4SS family [Candidatus Thermoplasmatota archaeon]